MLELTPGHGLKCHPSPFPSLWGGGRGGAEHASMGQGVEIDDIPDYLWHFLHFFNIPDTFCQLNINFEVLL